MLSSSIRGIKQMIKIPFVEVGKADDGLPILGPKKPIPANAIRIDATEDGWTVWQVGDNPPEIVTQVE